MSPLDVARSYHEKYGIPFDPAPSRLTLDPEASRATGRAFAAMTHDPADPAVHAAYDALKREVAQQYAHMVRSGVKVEQWRKPGQPYTNSAEMRADAEIGHLWYFPTDAGFGSGEDPHADHPLNTPVPGLKNTRFNDLFRAVHDYFGHAVHGHQFGPKGELNAWAEHARMLSPLARKALTTETHGQNSWVNFGPHEPEKLPVTSRPYADQKAGVLPPEVWPAATAHPKHLARAEEGKRTGLAALTRDDGTIRLYHFAHPGGKGEEFTTSPRRFGKNPWSQAEYRQDQHHKTFFYVHLKDKEGFFGDQHPLFSADVPAKHIYDVAADPDGHTAKTVGVGLGVPGLIDRLRRKGFHGMYYGEHTTFPTVIMWRGVKMKRHDLARVKYDVPHWKDHNIRTLMAVLEHADPETHSRIVGAAESPDFYTDETLGHLQTLLARRSDRLDSRSAKSVQSAHLQPVLYRGGKVTTVAPAKLATLPAAPTAKPVAPGPKATEVKYAPGLEPPVPHVSGGPRSGIMERPHGLAREKAPAGGAIINSQYTPGGQFMPKLAMKIRTAVKRRRGKNPLLRLALKYTTEGLRKAGATTDIPHPDRAGKLPAYAPDKLAAAGFDPHLPGTPATLSVDQIRSIEDAHNVPKTARLTEKDRLTVRPDGTVFVKNYNHYNNFMDAVAKNSLSGHALRSALLDPKHSSAERMVFLVNHLAGEARSFGEGLRRGNQAGEWYGKFLDGLDLALHHIFATKKDDPVWGTVHKDGTHIDRKGKPLHETAPGLVLARAMIATTSANKDPKSNLALVYQMLKAGTKRGDKGDPFSEIPDRQYNRLNELLTRVGHDGTVVPEGYGSDLSPAERKGLYTQRALEWAQKHVDPVVSAYGGHQNVPLKMLPVYVHKPTNRVLGWEQNDRITPHPQAVAEFGREEVAKNLLRATRGMADYARRDIPTVGPDGKVQPREWSQRPQARDGLLLLQSMLRDHTAKAGGDRVAGMRSLAGWLTAEHPRSVLEKFDTKNATFPDEKTLPGSFVFGPKFGAFMLNLLHHDPDKKTAERYGRFLTADMWWSRTWGRYVGRLRNLIVKKDARRYEPVSIPEDWERPVMQEAAHHAAKLAGLKSVAELQAVLWYWEQHLSRLFGLKSKSYSYLDGANEILHRHANETGQPLTQVHYRPESGVRLDPPGPGPDGEAADRRR